jgi:outer membrane receptor for ferrienterochelin and colicin
MKDNFYVEKSMMIPLSLEYQKIDMCTNFYMFHNEYANVIECKTYHHTQYILNSGRGRTLITYKKVRYFPIIPRL